MVGYWQVRLGHGINGILFHPLLTITKFQNSAAMDGDQCMAKISTMKIVCPNSHGTNVCVNTQQQDLWSRPNIVKSCSRFVICFSVSFTIFCLADYNISF